MRYYLAGPMTGLPDFNYRVFEAEQKKLRSQGLDVVSPHSIDFGETEEKPGSLPYQTYIKGGLKLLLTCDAIILMVGWENSKGCLTELTVASACGMMILFYNPVTGILSTNAGRINE
jgi:nucleoside 2-deoxyribosyltransferase